MKLVRNSPLNSQTGRNASHPGPLPRIRARGKQKELEPPFMQSDFVNRANTEYIDQLYQRYQTDPRSIDPQWREFFSRMDWEMPRPGGNGAKVAEEPGKTARPTEP